MRILSLNTWGGRQYEQLVEYVVAQAQSGTEVLCLQEVTSSHVALQPPGDFRSNLLQELQAQLRGYRSYFSPVLEFELKGGEQSALVRVGLATFVRETVLPDAWESHFLFGSYDEQYEGAASRLVQQLRWDDVGGAPLTIFNFHGTNGGGKVDTPLRLQQSAALRERLDAVAGRRVLIGDFNLRPDTQSLAVLTQGMVDLVRTHGIARTRSDLYEHAARSPFADYALVTPDVRVLRFTAPEVAVSDHLPLILEIA